METKGEAPSQDQLCTLWVGGISERVDEEILFELFLNAGPVQSVKIPIDRETKRQKPFAFVLFHHPETVSYAVDLFRDVTLFGRPLRLQNKETGAGMNESRAPAPSNGHQRPPNFHQRSFSAPHFQPGMPNHGAYHQPSNGPYGYSAPPEPVRVLSYNNVHSHYRERSAGRHEYNDYHRREDRSHYSREDRSHYSQHHQYEQHQPRGYDDRRSRERSHDRSHRDYGRRDSAGSNSGGYHHRR